MSAAAAATALQAVTAATMRTALQPIVSLGDHEVFASEALARVQGPEIDLATLFDKAVERGRSTYLNLIAIQSALRAAPRVAPDALLFINADPSVLCLPQLPAIIRREAEESDFPLSRLIVEITERCPFGDIPVAEKVLDELRADGVRFALDDFCSGHSHVYLLETIRPSFIKIARGVGTGFEESKTRTTIVRHIASFARDVDCRTIIEGVETAITAEAARALGIDYAQGFLFGAPIAPPPPVWWQPSERTHAPSPLLSLPAV